MIRVAEPLRAVGVDAAHGLAEVVHRAARVEAHLVDRLPLGGVQELGDRDAAGGGRPHRVHLVAPVRGAHRLALDGPVLGQVLLVDQPPVFRELLSDELGGFSLVEARRSVLLDPLERLGKVVLDEALPDPVLFRRIALGEVFLCCGKLGEVPVGAIQVRGEGVGQRKALTGEAESRGHDRFAVERAVLVEGFQEAGHGAGHAGGEVAPPAALADGIAVGIEVHVLCGAAGGVLAVVDGRDRAVGHADHHEAAPADVAGPGVHDGQGKAGGHGRVHGVAAFLEHLDARRGGGALRRDDHSVLGVLGDRGGRRGRRPSVGGGG